MLPLDAKRSCVAMLLALSLLLTSCATNSPTSVSECPAFPPIPAMSEPTPSRSFSESAQRLMESWLNRLTDSQVTDRP